MRIINLKQVNRLRQLFPTISALQKAKAPYTTWAHLAKALGVSRESIYGYKRELGMEKEIKTKVPKLLDNREINANVKELVGPVSRNIVTVYKIVDLEAFKRDQRGYEGLEYDRTEQGRTWGEIGHMTPNSMPWIGR